MVGVALWLLKTPAGGRSNYVTPVTTAFSVAVAAALIFLCILLNEYIRMMYKMYIHVNTELTMYVYIVP